MQSAIQLYSLRDLDRSLAQTIELVGEYDLDGVEFAGIGDEQPEVLWRALDDADLEVAGAHVDAERIEDDPGTVAQQYRTLGCETIVVPWLDAENFATRDAARSAADRLRALADALATHDFEFAYHNHDQEFQVLDDGTTAIEIIDDATTDDVAFELDVGWAQTAGYDPVTVLQSLGDRISHVHIKDVDLDADDVTELGTGDVDIEACLRTAREVGVEWLIFEHDHPEDAESTLSRAADIL
jgi:sugar phosphate isomerase/epimerase